MSASKIRLIRLFLGFMWLSSGISKLPVLIAETLTGKAMMSEAMPFFANACFLPSCGDFIRTYLVPIALFVLFADALVEITGGFLIWQTGNRAKLGLAMGVALNVIYWPITGMLWVTFANVFFAGLQIWVFQQDLSENLLTFVKNKILRR